MYIREYEKLNFVEKTNYNLLVDIFSKQTALKLARGTTKIFSEIANIGTCGKGAKIRRIAKKENYDLVKYAYCKGLASNKCKCARVDYYLLAKY